MLNFQKGRSHTTASYKNKRKQQSRPITPQYNTQSENPLVPHTPPANPKKKTILDTLQKIPGPLSATSYF